MFGRVAAIARKTPPEDRSQVAWNHALGCAFENVKWDQWPMDVCMNGVLAARESGLDYAAVDVMVEKDTGRVYTIEINSAGSLPRNADRSPSYRARCVANALAWHLEREDYTHLDGTFDYDVNDWRSYIHPGIWDNHKLNTQ